MSAPAEDVHLALADRHGVVQACDEARAVSWEAQRERADLTGRKNDVTCPVCRVVIELRAAERSGRL